MPGRSSSSSGSTGFISFSGIESALSSLKNFQSCISSGMDTASSVALDLVETQTEVSSEYSMDKAMVELAMMDRELNHYVKAVQSAISHVKEERPEKIPDLKLLVEKKFLALQNKNCDADFQNNAKFVQFKQQLKELKKQSAKPKEDGGHNEVDKIKDKDARRAGNERGSIGRSEEKYVVSTMIFSFHREGSRASRKNDVLFTAMRLSTLVMPHCSYGAKPTLGLTKPTSSVRDEATESAPDGLQADREADGTEGVDEDMIVTQSQTNFICPITQVEMKKPVKNKVCGHTYEEEAIVRMIESKHRRKKKACCPKIGCSHTDVRMSDLIQDEALRRAIENHNKKKNRHSE
ncbi:E3 SUMO-protein ligase NSE2 isoform X1 [Canis lupus baileyi]|uniref:E3 SUMO-protein ligase NSE2 isoform X2 n=1 Tax=Canis lupus dingo TaxID=286419 RepID=UPI0020C364FA|nr:E3 SUMO-protein ligase NSE2 isoform X2 [Canis lupus dingo]